jgi:hypothetical protein
VSQLAQAYRKSFEAFGEVMSGGLAFQGCVHGEHDLVDSTD